MKICKLCRASEPPDVGSRVRGSSCLPTSSYVPQMRYPFGPDAAPWTDHRFPVASCGNKHLVAMITSGLVQLRGRTQRLLEVNSLACSIPRFLPFHSSGSLCASFPVPCFSFTLLGHVLPSPSILSISQKIRSSGVVLTFSSQLRKQPLLRPPTLLAEQHTTKRS
jgi:hypothetical protein